MTSEINEYIKQRQYLQDIFLDFLDSEDESNENYGNFINFFESQKFYKTRSELKGLLYYINQIANNHHRNQYFSQKIERIILFLQ